MAVSVYGEPDLQGNLQLKSAVDKIISKRDEKRKNGRKYKKTRG